MYASYPSSIEIAPKLDSALSISLRFARIAIEFSAVILSEVITDLRLAALESGVIARRWLKANGEDFAKMIGWATLRTLGMLLLGFACLICILGLSIRLNWIAAKIIWVWANRLTDWVNRVTDDGLGLYGPSPLLAQWTRGFKSSFVMKVPAPALPHTFDIPALDLSGTELVAWAQLRWPQLIEIGRES